MQISILLADDSPTIAKILGLALSKEEYVIQTVAEGNAAQEALLQDPPQILIVDYALPYKSGLELSKFVHSNPLLAKVKIILLTNAFDQIDASKCHAAGVDEILSKPFEPNEIRSALSKLAPESTQSTSPSTSKDALAVHEPKIELPTVKDLASPELDESAMDAPPPPPAMIPKSKESKEQAKQTDPLSDAMKEWQAANTGTKADLSGWQSTQQKKEQMIDTSKSTLKFSKDYIDRIGSSASDLGDDLSSPRANIPIFPSNSKNSEDLDNEITKSTVLSGIHADATSEKIAKERIHNKATLTQHESSKEDLQEIVAAEIRKICEAQVEAIAQKIVPEIAEQIIQMELNKVLAALDEKI